MTLYDLLLRLYPESFRNEYGGEMRAIFRRRRAQTGMPGAVPLWIGTVAEVLANAAGAHLDILKQDLAYAVRMLTRARGFALTAILIVALGIGATTAAFSVTDFVLIRPLPFPEPSRLVKVWEKTPGYSRMELSPPNYRDWKAAARSFESIGAYFTTSVTMISGGEPRRFNGASVGADLLSVLGVAPLLGRTFSADDDRPGAPGTIVLSYRLWQTEFAGEPDILGRTLMLDGAPSTVIGVMPREFNFPSSDRLFWVPNRFAEAAYSDRTNNYLNAVARLRPGVTIDQARAEMELVATQSAQQYPRENKDTGASIVALRDEVSWRSRQLLLALSGAAGCVLLIACANLANLLLARALSRRRELAVRAAMGAGRERLIRQLMTESLLLAAAGGALGIAIAVAAVPLLAQLVPGTLPIAALPSVDMRVLAVAVGLTALTGIAFGSVPIVRVGGKVDFEGLREGSRAGSGQKERLRSALVVGEIVVTMVLLVSAGLLIRALLTVQAIHPGFNAEGVITMRVELPMPAYRQVADREAFYSRVLDEVRRQPGVTSAGFVSFLPISAFRGGIWPVSVPGDVNAADTVRGSNNVASLRYMTPGFLQAMGTPIKLGRDIRDSDTRDRPFVAIVSESFVQRYWPGLDPIGRRFTFALAEREVVGVAGDVRFRGLERTSEPQVYLPSAQVNDGAIIFYAPRDLAVRATAPAESIGPVVRSIIRTADPALPISRVQTLEQMLDVETASRSVQVRVVSAFAFIAFVLAAVGIHGVLSFMVSQRTQEIGVRLALGAQRGDILKMVVRRGGILAVVGVIPGVAIAYAAGRGMEALLAGVRPADTATLVAAVGMCALMSVVGGLAPTLRAVRVDPITALRAE